jgi:hypothetical protein
MKPTVRLVLVFMAGLVLGGAGVALAWWRGTDFLLRTWLVTNTFEETLTLRELELGGPERYKKRIFAYALPGFAESLAKRRGEPEVDGALWAIRLAYQREWLELPARVAPHVQNLPPEAEMSCRKKREEMETKAAAPAR